MTAEWGPTAEHRRDRVTVSEARSLHDLLERTRPAPVAGDQLPILWHWLAFTPRAKQSEIGPDGHPTTGGFLPPMASRRRMFAGGKATINGSVVIGEPLERMSLVSDIAEKHGKSGALSFVTVQHEVSAAGGSVREHNDLVYKDSQPSNSAPAKDSMNDAEWSWGRALLIDPVILFRFSALTYNAHRIHYDRDYTTGVEGYPGLVVQGPLQAVLLADLAERTFPEHVVVSIAFRSRAPAFDDSALELRARRNPETGELELAAFTTGGAQTMSARATLVPRKEELK